MIKLKWARLAMVLLLYLIVSVFVWARSAPSRFPPQVTFLLAVCFLNTIVLTHIILRSRWSGWRLIDLTFTLQ